MSRNRRCFAGCFLPQWKYDGGKITDGTYSVYIHVPQNVSVSFGEFFCNFTVALPPCAEAVLYFAFGRGEISSDFSYDDEKAKTEAFWEHELSKIKSFPEKRRFVFLRYVPLAGFTGIADVLLSAGG